MPFPVAPAIIAALEAITLIVGFIKQANSGEMTDAEMDAEWEKTMSNVRASGDMWEASKRARGQT